MDDIIKIAIGVFIGALAAAFAWEGIQTIRLELAAERAKQEIQRAQRKMRDEERARTRALQEADRQRLQAQRERDEQSHAVADAQRQAERDREAAWNRYYKPSTGCVADPTTIPCANEHMKARKLFEIQYNAGTLR